jgi:hypothetical protein
VIQGLLFPVDDAVAVDTRGAVDDDGLPVVAPPEPSCDDAAFAARVAELAAAIDAEADTVASAPDADGDEEPDATDAEWPVNVREGQGLLFVAPERFDDDWQGMPEFAQDDQRPWKTMRVHFRNEADLRAFAILVQQQLTSRTRSCWYPMAEEWHFMDKRWQAARESDA